MADKQTSIFENILAPAAYIDSELVVQETVTWTVFIDGASRGNPGAAGAGVYIKKNKEVFFKSGFFLGKKTNNEAEYFALLLALFFVAQYAQPKDTVLVYSDSLLLIQQMNGVYKIKKPMLKNMHAMAVAQSNALCVRYEHVLREYNALADELANQGVDKKITLPLKFLDMLQNYEIFI